MIDARDRFRRVAKIGDNDLANVENRTDITEVQQLGLYRETILAVIAELEAFERELLEVQEEALAEART